MALQPFEWRDKRAFIEASLFPVQKISAESFKEQEGRQSKTLTPLGSYWKGRKPLILNKACVLGALLPATDDPLKDLEIFELLMGMDQESMRQRIEAKLPDSRTDEVVAALTRPYREQVDQSLRPEELDDELFSHIWDTVNAHLGTSAHSFPELVEQMGIARFGHRPKVADVFCGSGQIPFEAARLGCDVYASDLNPLACMLTWGTFNLIGSKKEKCDELSIKQSRLLHSLKRKINELGVETDEYGWQAKVYLYCVEIVCPQTGWKVPLLPSRLISKGHRVIAELIPNPTEKRYSINIRYIEDDEDIEESQKGATVQKGYVVHSPDGINEYRINIKELRGDYRVNKEIKNKLRHWDKKDFTPSENDIFQERLYCILWMKEKPQKNPYTVNYTYKFSSVTPADLVREQKVIDYVREHLAEWQEKGYVPDMVIEKGDETERLYRERGWTHWHHLFNPRQLLLASLINQYSSAELKYAFTQVLNNNARLSRWNSRSGVGQTASVFDNQALNTLYNYGCRGSAFLDGFLTTSYKSYPFRDNLVLSIKSHPAHDLKADNDIYITDPPYGDAVKYEEITEFFIAWLRKNPPPEFADWTWDSRRALAIQGEGEEFRQGMIAAYRNMREHMPDNGIQILMFTHQSGAIWAEMANIIWAAGLQVTAAWYVVTETDSALRQGANVKGTVILVLRKRLGEKKTYREELGEEIELAVKEQVELMTGLDKRVREHGAEGLYNDSDLQMAGNAAALKVLTAYSGIDGKDMAAEAAASRRSSGNTFVDELIDFAERTAAQYLIPSGFPKEDWNRLQPVERFYLKMAEGETRGEKSIDNYQNFAKAYKVRDYSPLMSDSTRANAARLKLGIEFKGTLMSGNSEIAGTPLRALLYGIHEIAKGVETDDALLHLMDNCFGNYMNWKPLLAVMADFLAAKRDSLKPARNFAPDEEARAARILAEAIRHQNL